MNQVAYQKPELIDIGNVETITLATGGMNRDTRTGPPNTGHEAFPNV